ncbi:MAG: HD domain-containing protein [bacterium]|nr:HD domain-containing protein [bacterium]
MNRECLATQCRLCGESVSDHCERVGDLTRKLAQPLGEPRRTFAACGGYLHDILEDAVDWNAPTAGLALRWRIEETFGGEVLRITEAVTVDQRLSPEDQFALMVERARSKFQIPELLVKLADIFDNWQTRHVYSVTYRTLWERFAHQMVDEVIPERLRQCHWEGPVPVLGLEPVLIG